MIEKCPDEIIETVVNMAWNHERTDGQTTITDTYQHNACNHTYSGTTVIDGDGYGFVIDSGDWCGDVVRRWGLADDVPAYDPPDPVVYTMVPQQERLYLTNPGMWRVYLSWRRQEWFTKLCSGYNYDRHFAPGSKTEEYYRSKAAEKGMCFATIDEFRQRSEEAIR